MQKVYWVSIGLHEATWAVIHDDPTGELFTRRGDLERDPGEWQLEAALNVIRARGDRVMSILHRKHLATHDMYWVVTEPLHE